MKKGMIKTMGLFMGLAALAGTGQSQLLNANQYNVRQARSNDAVAENKQMPTRPVKSLIRAGGENPYRHYRRGYRNQRQYWKHLRSNPHLRNSKKCKL